MLKLKQKHRIKTEIFHMRFTGKHSKNQHCPFSPYLRLPLHFIRSYRCSCTHVTHSSLVHLKNILDLLTRCQSYFKLGAKECMCTKKKYHLWVVFCLTFTNFIFFPIANQPINQSYIYHTNFDKLFSIYAVYCLPFVSSTLTIFQQINGIFYTRLLSF